MIQRRMGSRRRCVARAVALGVVAIEEGAGLVRFEVRVVPRASRDAIVGAHDGALKVALTAPPVEGEANAALIALLAKKLGVAKRDVSLLRGESSRSKRVEVRGIDAATIRALVR